MVTNILKSIMCRDDSAPERLMGLKWDDTTWLHWSVEHVHVTNDMLVDLSFSPQLNFY